MAAVETRQDEVRAAGEVGALERRARRGSSRTTSAAARVPEARTILAFSQRAAAQDVEKVLRSAVANAESRPTCIWNGDDLVVVTAYVDEGPTLKRWRARARGRAAEDPQAHVPHHRRPRAGGHREDGELVGQKIHPGGLRVGVIHDWKSNWYTGKKEFPAYLLEDVKIREHIYKKLAHAGLSDILIRKDKQRITVDIYTARPGIVIGKSGVEVDALRRELHALTQKNVHININEIKRPELDAKLVAQSIAEQLQNRVSFRRAMKRALASAIRSGAEGVKIQCGGRLGGGEMSRRETYCEGRVPLHTIRADIDYGFVEAKTTFGRIGVKVWINKGEIMPEGYEGSPSATSASATRTRSAAAAAQSKASARRARAAAAAVPTARASARCVPAGGAARPAAGAGGGRPGQRRGPGAGARPAGGGGGDGRPRVAIRRRRLRLPQSPQTPKPPETAEAP